MSKFGDIYLIETGDGGDLVLSGNDLKIVEGWENMVYIALFGGNPGYSTTGPKIVDQQFDWWGNYMLSPSNQKVWINSTLEYLINNTAINSSGRVKLEQAILNDLSFMRDFAKITASVTLINVDRIKISITIMEPDIKSAKEFVYIWDSTRLEIDSLPEQSTTPQGIALNNMLNFGL